MSILRMQQRRGSSINCAACSEVIRDGEIIVEKCLDGSFKMKIGDGVKKFSELPYVACSDTVLTLIEKNKLTGIEVGAQVNVIETIKINGVNQSVADKVVDLSIPTKTSDLENDSGYITGSGWNDISSKPFSTIDSTTLVVSNGVLAVNTTNDAEQDNTKPITSGGVHTILGNIEVLMSQI